MALPRTLPRTLHAACAALILAASAHSQPPAPGAPDSMQSLRVVEADPEDRGTPRIGSRAMRNVTFENALSVPISVEITEKTYGCLDVAFDAETIAPGARARLKLAVAVVPTAAPQAQFVTFRAAWEQGGVRHSERGMCGLRYRPNVSVVVRPEAAAIASVIGEQARLDVFVRFLDAPNEMPELTHANCTLPGWRVVAVHDPDDPSGVAHFRVSGTMDEVGFADGKVTWTHEGGAQRELSVPIRVRTLSPWRSVPGGAVFLAGPQGNAEPRTLTLERRSLTSPAPASVRIEPPCEFVQIALQDARTLSVALRPGPTMPPAGTARGQVLAADGSLLLEFPIAWMPEGISRPLPPAK